MVLPLPLGPTRPTRIPAVSVKFKSEMRANSCERRDRDRVADAFQLRSSCFVCRSARGEVDWPRT